MRHRIAGAKLGRTTTHRKAMEANMMCSLIEHERIITTITKAKALRPAIEKMITMAKQKDLHRYRRALSRLQSKDAVAKLFDELGPRYANRPGGYTRVLRLGEHRIGDGGEKAIIELVDNKVLERRMAEAQATEG